MSVLPIRVDPDPILYKPCRDLTEEDFASGLVLRIATDLNDTMAALPNAAGLAAPQIGYDVRMFKIAQWPGAFVNPTIEYVVGKPISGTEGCFSLPGLQLTVERAAKIRMRYLTLKGEERAVKMRDRDGVCAQHEFDHLNGVTIVQRASVTGTEEEAA